MGRDSSLRSNFLGEKLEITFLDVITLLEQSGQLGCTDMNLAICQALILVDDVCVISIIREGRKPKFSEGRPQVLVHAIESAVYQACLDLMEAARRGEEALGWEGYCVSCPRKTVA